MRGKIALVHYSGPPVVGGVETVLHNQARFLAENGYPVKVVVGKGSPFHRDVEHVVVPELSSNFPAFVGLSRESFQAEVDRLARRFDEIFQDTALLIIHNVMTMPFNMVATAALKRVIEAGKRAVIWCHDSPFMDPSYRISRDEYPYSLLAEPVKGARYVTITEQRREAFSRLLGMPPDSILVVRNGIDLSHFLSLAPQAIHLIDEFRLYEKDLVVISPVRITRRKNLELCLRICAELREYYPNLLLIVTGFLDPHNLEARTYFEELKALVARLEMEREVVFLGEYRMEDGTPTTADWKATRDIYSLADILLLTSVSEGFGLPLLEAGLLRMPIVCTDIPTLREVARDVENVVFIGLEEKPEAVAGRIYQFLSSHRTFKHFKTVFREYNWNAIGKSFLIPIIREALGEERGNEA
ncbi:MAG: glycosyltransferase family 4 protein [Candidatus Geothermincolales bacterium]